MMPLKIRYYIHYLPNLRFILSALRRRYSFEEQLIIKLWLVSANFVSDGEILVVRMFCPSSLPAGEYQHTYFRCSD